MTYTLFEAVGPEKWADLHEMTGGEPVSDEMRHAKVETHPYSRCRSPKRCELHAERHAQKVQRREDRRRREAQRVEAIQAMHAIADAAIRQASR